MLGEAGHEVLTAPHDAVLVNEDHEELVSGCDSPRFRLWCGPRLDTEAHTVRTVHRKRPLFQSRLKSWCVAHAGVLTQEHRPSIVPVVSSGLVDHHARPFVLRISRGARI